GASLRDEMLLHPDAGTNVVFQSDFRHGDEFFDGCDVVVKERFENQRVAPCPLEVRAAAAAWNDDGRVTQWSSTQNPHSVRRSLAQALDIEPERVRVVCQDVGGSFGSKSGTSPEELLLPWLARHVGRPLRW